MRHVSLRKARGKEGPTLWSSSPSHSGAAGLKSHTRDSCLPGVAPHPGKDGGLRICIHYPGLNRVASQERFWPSRMGCCEGPPHNYVCMPFGLPNAAATYQRHLPSILETQEAKHHTILAEMEMVLKEPPGPPEPPEAQGFGGS